MTSSPLASPRRARYTDARLRCFAVALALVGAVRVCAGPDDDFITIYNLIQVTDSPNSAGRVVDAREAYLKAQQLLRQLQKSYPTWNERVIAVPCRAGGLVWSHRRVGRRWRRTITEVNYYRLQLTTMADTHW